MRRHFSSSPRQSMPIADYIIFCRSPNDSVVVLCALLSNRRRRRNKESVYFMVVCDTLRDAFASSFHLNRRSFAYRALGSISPISIRCGFDENICIFYCFFMEKSGNYKIWILNFRFFLLIIFVLFPRINENRMRAQPNLQWLRFHFFIFLTFGFVFRPITEIQYNRNAKNGKSRSGLA